MNRTLILPFLFMISCNFVSAQEGNFTVSVSNDSILMGNTFEITFTLENEDGNLFEAPTFKDFDLISGPAQRSSFSMINGKTTQSSSYTYALAPKSAGSFYIDPAYINVGEKSLETLPLSIDIYPNPEGIIQKRSTKDSFFENTWDFGRQLPTPQTPVKPKSKRKRKIYRI